MMLAYFLQGKLYFVSLKPSPKNSTFFSREKLCSNQKCQTSGIGTVSGMCTPQSYAVVEDAGLSKGHTIAHEFGHL